MKYNKLIYFSLLFSVFMFTTNCFKDQETLDELKIRDIVKGEGEIVENGDTLTVDYQGWLENGTQFDSSIDRGVPFIFTIGIGQVIEGWDEGILLLKKGAAARFVIPSHLGYGSQGAGGVIPSDATLVFDVELLDF